MFVFLSVSFGHCIVLYGRHQFLITPFVSSNFSNIHGQAIIITFVLRAKLLFFASLVLTVIAALKSIILNIESITTVVSIGVYINNKIMPINF